MFRRFISKIKLLLPRFLILFIFPFYCSYSFSTDTDKFTERAFQSLNPKLPVGENKKETPIQKGRIDEFTERTFRLFREENKQRKNPTDLDLQQEKVKPVRQDPPCFSQERSHPIGNQFLELEPYLTVDNSWSVAAEYETSLLGLHPKVLELEDQVNSIFQEFAGRNAIITFTTNGTHSDNSLHYVGCAIDLRTYDILGEPGGGEALNDIVEKLKEIGSDYYVEHEETHIHIEYDPKGPEKVGLGCR